VTFILVFVWACAVLFSVSFLVVVVQKGLPNWMADQFLSGSHADRIATYDEQRLAASKQHNGSPDADMVTSIRTVAP
jgi:hypothetical protein